MTSYAYGWQGSLYAVCIFSQSICGWFCWRHAKELKPDQLRRVPMYEVKSSQPMPVSRPTHSVPQQEVRCAVRFPLSLPVVLTTPRGDLSAITRNVSANGVLFEVNTQLAPGAEIHFCLRMPCAVLGTPRDVLVQCQGRVVRCSISQSHYLSAATIDDYKFTEQ